MANTHWVHATQSCKSARNTVEVTRYIEGFYGEERVLLEGDVDLSANLPACGYAVDKFLASDLTAKLLAATERLVCDHVAQVLGPETSLENFSISR